MRNAKACTKCRSADIMKVPGTVSGYGAGNNINLGSGLWTSTRFVKVTRYVCGACGFCEEWIDAPEDIAKIKKVFGEQA